MKKIIALACTLMMLVSVFASTTIVANAAVDGVEVELKFVGFEPMNATYDYAVVEVYLDIPDTLSPYEAVPNDDPFAETTYNGKLLQSIGIDITVPAGMKLQSFESNASYIEITNNATNVNNGGTVKLVHANSSSDYNTYYSGEVGGKIATLKFLAMDYAEGFDLELTDAALWLLVFDNTAKGTPTPYVMEDFTLTDVTVKSADPDPVPVDKYVEAEDVVTELEAAEGTYTNIAIFKAAFEGLQEKGATQIGYDLTKAESAVNNGKVITTTIEGNGKVEFALAIYGITAEQVDELTFAPYYTVLEAPAAN